MRTTIRLLVAVALLSGCGVASRSSTGSSPAGFGALDPRTPLTDAQRDWVERTLASLTLRERAGQMVNV